MSQHATYYVVPFTYFKDTHIQTHNWNEAVRFRSVAAARREAQRAARGARGTDVCVFKVPVGARKQLLRCYESDRGLDGLKKRRKRRK